MDRSLGECAIGDAAWAARILDFPVDYLVHLHDRADGVDAEFLRSAMVDIVDSREDISWLFADNVPLLLLSPPFHAALAARSALALDCGFERGHRIVRGRGMEGADDSGCP